MLYLVFAVIVIAVVLFPSSLPTRMPIYQGRSIDQWYSDFAAAESPPEVRARAAEVLREMGTNETPALIKRLRDVNDSRFKLKLMALLNRQSWIKFSFTTAEQRRESAYLEFIFWGPGTAAAVPELERMCRDTNTDLVQLALRALGTANMTAPKPILDSMLQATTSTNLSIRATAILCLASVYKDWIGRPNATNMAAFPTSKMTAAFQAGLKDPDPYIRILSVDQLRNLQIEPEVFVPMLTGSLQDTNASIRFGAARALGSYGAAARRALPALNAALQDPDKSVGSEAAKSLKQIEGEPAATNPPASQPGTDRP